MTQKKRIRLELGISAATFLFFAVTAAMGTREVFGILEAKIASGETGPIAKQIGFMALVASLLYGGLVYQLCRFGFLWRRLRHQPADKADSDWMFHTQAPPVTVLIPSYKEESRVIWQTLFSACLQEYPNKNVVLLIDNPPDARREDDRILLEQARQIPPRMNHLFSGIHAEISEAWRRAHRRIEDRDHPVDWEREWKELSRAQLRAAKWCRSQANQYSLSDHTDRFFTQHVLYRTLRELERRSEESAGLARSGTTDRLIVEYERLLAMFSVRVSCFERKHFENLSHEPNKAMNLNSYLSLIGKSWKAVPGPKGTELVQADPDEESFDASLLHVRAAKYCVTLDADSILLPDYIQTLVNVLERPENHDLAVIQTPYSAFPRSTSAIERIAGATTDIQYLIHQGFTFFNATFWVGANAVLRHQALLDIAETAEERGHTVMRYIQDHTVIEDTESTIDLVSQGWRLENYPQRLSYSATPPDFGALLIQRRRWANGGLLIFPKLLRSFFDLRRMRKAPAAHVAEMFVRSHYLLSIAMVNVALLILLGFSFEDCARSIVLPLTALPYYVLYGRDLRLNGYRFGDLLDVYALNLLLIPVNLGGVLKSIHQGLTGASTPFARTPKVSGRTSAPRLYVGLEAALAGSWLMGGVFSVLQGHPTVGGFALAHGLLLAYGLFRFIGWKAFREDLFPREQSREWNNVLVLAAPAARNEDTAGAASAAGAGKEAA